MVQAELVVMSGPLNGTRLEIDSYTVVLGRSPETTFDLSGYTELSRQHAVIRWDGYGWVIEDQSSSNGTVVDGAVVQTAPLKCGAIIELGDFKAEFVSTTLINNNQRKMVTEEAKQLLGGAVTVIVLLFIVGEGLVGAYRWLKSITQAKPLPKLTLTPRLPAVLNNPPTQLSALSPAVGNLTLPTATTGGSSSNPSSPPNLLSPTPTSNQILTNAQALILQQDSSGNWFRVGAGTVVNSNTVLVASQEVLNIANKLTDVEVVLGSTAPYTREDIPASSITLHGDVARISLTTPVLIPLPSVLQTTDLMNTTVTIVLLDQLSSSTEVHLQHHPVIANYYLQPGTKQQTLSGFEVNYHDQYNYAGAPVFDVNNNLVGMAVGTRHSETFNHKLVVYGYNMTYLQSW